MAVVVVCSGIYVFLCVLGYIDTYTIYLVLVVFLYFCII